MSKSQHYVLMLLNPATKQVIYHRSIVMGEKDTPEAMLRAFSDGASKTIERHLKALAA